MQLYSWNVNGLRACWAKGNLANWLEASQPDFLCLQEIKATEEQSPIGDLRDYRQTWFPSQTKKGYSGVLTLSRQTPKTVQRGFPSEIAAQHQLVDKFGDLNAEGRLLALDFGRFWLINVYVPNSKGDLGRIKVRQAWDSALKDYHQVLSAKKPVLICGDLNVAHQEIDLARPKDNVGKHGFTNEERQGLSNLLDTGLIDSFRHLHPDRTEAYSWWAAWGGARSRNVGWRIDYWLVDQRLKPAITSATIESEIMGSDHCPVGLKLDF